MSIESITFFKNEIRIADLIAFAIGFEDEFGTRIDIFTVLEESLKSINIIRANDLFSMNSHSELKRNDDLIG